MSKRFERLAIKRVASVWLGKMVQAEPKDPSDVSAPYLRAAHVQPNGRVVDVDDKEMWFSPGELLAQGLKSGDVVVVEGGAGFGRSAVLREKREGWGFQNSIVRVRPRAGKSDGRFIDYALQSALADGEIAVACNIATIPHFTAEKVASFAIPAPPVEVQRSIADFLDAETAKIDALIAQQERIIALAKERRAAMIKAAVNGDLDVSVESKAG